ncbi:MAG: biopolymer transporter ExbD [Prevotellaceae bacterium]|jgi:biopolymer transport protein ExbD|nr:biopolymer transporter ExbD [Prevotellaceae bacterium]
MAEVNSGGHDEGKKGKPKKQTLRVDFTPMVDMNMLLITFFMFCTTLSKPQMMTLVVPAKDKVDITEQSLIDKDKTLTVILGEDSKCYYYVGELTPDKYADYKFLSETNYGKDGLRQIIVDKNRKAAIEIQNLRTKKAKKEIKEDEFEEQSKLIRTAKDNWVVIIKPTNGATFADLVAVLDEMQICAVGTYAIVDLTEGDKYLVQNYQEKGALSRQAGIAD